MLEVFGSSDDLIELSGDLREEFSCLEPEGALLAFSNGLVLRVVYSGTGVWRITPVTGSGYRLTQAPENDPDNYSDRALLDDNISWVVMGSAIARR